MNKKKLLIGCVAIVVAVVATVNVTLSNARTSILTDLQLANIEALAQNENSHKYETKTTDEITVLDDATGTYKKISVTICEGTGDIDC